MNDLIKQTLDNMIDSEEPSCLEGGSRTSYTEITAFFDKSITNKMTQEKHKYWKDIDVLIKYGYRGCSLGGKNGITKITKRDKNIYNQFTKDLKNGLAKQIINKFFFYEPNDDEICGVKIVSHKRNGNRLVGVMDETKRKAVFYDDRQF